MNRTREIMSESGWSPAERAEVESQMYQHLRQLNNYANRGIFPMPTPASIAPCSARAAVSRAASDAATFERF